MRIESKILKHLLLDEDFTRKALPFLKSEYFHDAADKTLFNQINEYVTKYNTLPTYEALVIEINNRNLTESLHKETVQKLDEITENKETSDTKWLIDAAEEFCKDKAVYNAIMQSIQILDASNKGTLDKGSIPTLLADALSVAFDNHIGHDFLDDADPRYEFYHKVEQRIPFDLDYLNRITKGGLPEKTLNIILAGTGVGKSLFMCHVAAACLSQGHNVLYITLEMAEEKIAERIDANLMNIPIDKLKSMSKDLYNSRINKIKEKTNGKLIIKEYPTASAHVGHFRALISELQLKRQFKPDILMIDYLNICASSRYKAGAGVNSYTLVKSIAEEIRGLAVEFNIPAFTATQTTRSGFSNTDVDLTDTSESFGTTATADLMFALITSEELEQLNQLMVKQLKNRYNDPTTNKRFCIGIDRSKMKLYDLEQSAQRGIHDSGIKLEPEDIEHIDINNVFKRPIRNFSDFKL